MEVFLLCRIQVPLHEYSPAAEQLRQDRDDEQTSPPPPSNEEEPTILFLTKEQVLDLNSGSRAKHFLTCHVLSSLVIMAPFVFWMIVFVQVQYLVSLFNNNVNDLVSQLCIIFKVFPTFQGVGERVFFDLNLLNILFLPILGFSLAMSLLLARPYHRCESICTLYFISTIFLWYLFQYLFKYNCSGGGTPKGNFLS